MTYRINTDTNQLVEDNNNLGSSFYQAPWIAATQQEIDDWLVTKAKDSKQLEIEPARKIYQYSNIVIVNGGENEFVCTETAQNKLEAIYVINDWDSQLSIQWRLSDNITWITLTKTEVENILDNIVVREISAYQQESAYLVLLRDALTIEDINNIVIDFT